MCARGCVCVGGGGGTNLERRYLRTILPRSVTSWMPSSKYARTSRLVTAATNMGNRE